MAFSFLFDYSILNSAFFGTQDDFNLSCKNCIDKIFRLCKINNPSCNIFSPSQTVDKIKRGFENLNTQSKFEEIFNRQGATQGVESYNPEDYNTLKESGKALSFYGKVVIISNEEREINPNIKIMSPVKFISSYAVAKKLYSIFTKIDKIKFIDLLIFIIFHEDSLQRMNFNE